MVFRGKAKENVSSMRPLHLESYRIRNAKLTRDYFSADQVFIVGDLVAQGVELLVRLRRDPGVVGHAQRNVIYALCPQLLPDVMNVHNRTS